MNKRKLSLLLILCLIISLLVLSACSGTTGTDNKQTDKPSQTAKPGETVENCQPLCKECKYTCPAYEQDYIYRILNK